MTEATSIATIFEDFAIDHTPDGWPAVQQMHLNAAAAELRRLQTAEDEQLTALGQSDAGCNGCRWKHISHPQGVEP